MDGRESTVTQKYILQGYCFILVLLPQQRANSINKYRLSTPKFKKKNYKIFLQKTVWISHTAQPSLNFQIITSCLQPYRILRERACSYMILKLLFLSAFTQKLTTDRLHLHGGSLQSTKRQLACCTFFYGENCLPF